MLSTYLTFQSTWYEVEQQCDYKIWISFWYPLCFLCTNNDKRK